MQSIKPLKIYIFNIFRILHFTRDLWISSARLDTFCVVSKSAAGCGGGAPMVSNSKNTESIVCAAMELFREKGYSCVTVKDICSRSGVASSSFYTVFSGKDDILVHILKGHKDVFEETMLSLLAANSGLEKLWVLYKKYLDLGEELGAELISAMFKLELDGRMRLISSVNGYVEKYNSWFVRFVDECQKTGAIQNPGNAAELVPMGVRLTFFVLLEWCAAKGTYSLKERAFKEMESFYNVSQSLRGIYENI